MLEFILIISVITAAISGFVTYFWLTHKRVPVPMTGRQTTIGSTQAVPSQNEIPKPPRLEVSGAIHPPKAHFGFLRLYGLGYAPVYDLCFLPGPLTKDNLAPLVASSLTVMHGEGDAVGQDVMDFIHHGRTLTKNEVLCFALLAKPNDIGHRIVAFVDKLRFPVPA
jgi:hypothetical protein